ncbi:MAG TPA: hypothetical protein VKA53_07790 [Thermoanaerobaculia bacterium]|nr:hypothetical protein [Thermoanaerobaculia bacterium]
MTKLLEKAFEEASRLSEDEQNSFAEWLLAEIRSERRWAEAFSGSQNKLAHLAREALDEEARGRTSDLDPESF